MIALFDFDSLVYSSVYFIVDFDGIREYKREAKTLPLKPDQFFKEVRKLLGYGWSKDRIRSRLAYLKRRSWMETEIVNLAVNRCTQIKGKVLLAIEETGIEITQEEYFLTAPTHSARSQVYPEYKAHRRKRRQPLTKWVNKVRRYLCHEMDFATKSDTWEADDLVYDRAKEIGEDKCIIISMDKDLKQVPGLHFDVYRRCVFSDYCEYPKQEVEDASIYRGHDIKYVENAKPLTDQYGQIRKSYRGLDVITHREAELNFWSQVIGGDHSDNIKGARGFSVDKARELLKEANLDQMETIAKKCFETAELKALKTELNKGEDSKKWKKLNFVKFEKLFHSTDWDKSLGCGIDLLDRANQKFELNYFLIKLGTKR